MKKKRSVQKDKRKAQRISMDLDTKISLTDRGAKWQKSECINVSGMGFCLKVPNSVNKGSIIRVSVSSENIRSGIVVKCRVMWAVPFSGNEKMVGVQILKVSNPTAFVELICDEMINQPLISIL